MMLHQNLSLIKFMDWRQKNFGPPGGRGGGGVWGKSRRARAFRRSEAEAVSFVQKMFERSCIIPPIGNCKLEGFASLRPALPAGRSATNLYWILGVKTNWRFCILGEENFLIIFQFLSN